MFVQRLNIQSRLMQPYLAAGCLVIAFLFLFSNTFTSLAEIWWTRDDLSHGFLVPFISLYIAWTMREKLKSLPVRPNSVLGILVMILAGLILLAGKASSIVAVQGFSIIVMLIGIILLSLGTTYLRILLFPISYLILMLPILGIGTEKIHWPFQLLAAKMSSIILQFFNIPVYQNAQYLEMPTISLEVAHDCSGINFLISIIAIGIPLAYFTQKTLTRMVLLVVLAVAIGIAANWFRVVLIALWAYNGGEVVHGPWHIFKGVFVSFVGYIFLLIGAVVLSKIPMQGGSKFNKKERGIPANPDPSHHDTREFRQEWAIALVILLAFGSYSFARPPQPVPLIKPLSELPLTIEGWYGENIDHPKEFFTLNGADSEITRAYRNASGNKVILYIGYFEFQRQGAEIIQRKFQRLHDHATNVEIPAGTGDPLQIHQTIWNDRVQNYLVLFWSDLNGRVISNRYSMVSTSILDGIIHGRSNGAVVIIYSELDRPEELQGNLDIETGFVQSLMTVLYDYLPSSSNA